MHKFFYIILIIFTSVSNAQTPAELKSTEESKLFVQQVELKESEANVNNTLTIIKDISHIFFFLTMGTIGYLSYRQAKRTVFSPIKTEIFKFQLSEFKKVIGHFQNKSENELKADLDIETILNVNGLCLYKEFVETFFSGEIKLDEKTFKNTMAKAPRSFISKEFFDKHFCVISAKSNVDLPKELEAPKDPALKLAQWHDKTFGAVHFSEKHHEATMEIKEFLSSPLLPKELKAILSDYTELVHQSLLAVISAIEEVAKELPTVCSSKEKIDDFSPGWLSNVYGEHAPLLEPKALEILAYINGYLKIDDLANKK